MERAIRYTVEAKKETNYVVYQGFVFSDMIIGGTTETYFKPDIFTNAIGLFHVHPAETTGVYKKLGDVDIMLAVDMGLTFITLGYAEVGVNPDMVVIAITFDVENTQYQRFRKELHQLEKETARLYRRTSAILKKYGTWANVPSEVFSEIVNEDNRLITLRRDWLKRFLEFGKGVFFSVPEGVVIGKIEGVTNTPVKVY